MQLPEQSRWSQGKCTGVVGPRSYEITIGNTKYRRNRKQLIQAGSLPKEDTIPLETMHMPQPESQPVNTECSSQTDSMETTESPTTTAPTTIVSDNAPDL